MFLIEYTVNSIMYLNKQMAAKLGLLMQVTPEE